MPISMSIYFIFFVFNTFLEGIISDSTKIYKHENSPHAMLLSFLADNGLEPEIFRENKELVKIAQTLSPFLLLMPYRNDWKGPTFDDILNKEQNETFIGNDGGKSANQNKECKTYYCDRCLLYLASSWDYYGKYCDECFRTKKVYYV